MIDRKTECRESREQRDIVKIKRGICKHLRTTKIKSCLINNRGCINQREDDIYESYVSRYSQTYLNKYP